MLIWGISWGSLKSECSYLLQESSGTTHLSFVGFNVTFIHFTREIFSPLTALWKFKTVHIQSLFFFSHFQRRSAFSLSDCGLISFLPVEYRKTKQYLSNSAFLGKFLS